VQQLQAGRSEQRLVAVGRAGQPTQIHERRAQALAAGEEVHQDVACHVDTGIIEVGGATLGHEFGDVREHLAAQPDSPHIELTGVRPGFLSQSSGLGSREQRQRTHVAHRRPSRLIGSQPARTAQAHVVIPP
jgi:hypothetical protein